MSGFIKNLICLNGGMVDRMLYATSCNPSATLLTIEASAWLISLFCLLQYFDEESTCTLQVLLPVITRSKVGIIAIINVAILFLHTSTYIRVQVQVRNIQLQELHTVRLPQQYLLLVGINLLL